MSLEHQIVRLGNGVRLATVTMPHMESVAVGLWADAGSRHEGPEEHGIAHLIEHMLFKGTPTRSALDIAREIEGIGASIDGYTVEDHTAYHAKAPAGKFEQLFDALSDLYLRPVMDPADLDIEKQVIHEEIAMVRDVPSQWLEDLISEATWGQDHPLGRSITGTSNTLEKFQRDDVLRFFRRAYCGENTVISVAGNIDTNEVSDIVAAKFADLETGAPIAFAAAPDPRPDHRFEEEDDQEQTHLALSFEGVTRHDPSRYAMKLLSVILGENMSSRLFQKLREEKALCYEVQSDFISFDDAG
ncbi:MAG: pitrilysin family protein, partial [Verrucomicrobiota bacterium]